MRLYSPLAPTSYRTSFSCLPRIRLIAVKLGCTGPLDLQCICLQGRYHAGMQA